MGDDELDDERRRENRLAGDRWIAERLGASLTDLDPRNFLTRLTADEAPIALLYLWSSGRLRGEALADALPQVWAAAPNPMAVVTGGQWATLFEHARLEVPDELKPYIGT
jgi:hypothetical protein